MIPPDRNQNKISSFEQVGMVDPFVRKEYSNKPESFLDPVYPESRYTDEFFQGKSIYFPQLKHMFKLMCACIGIAKPEELWFNKPVLEIQE